VLAPVGGIPIIRHFAFYLHPVRFKLEEVVGHSIVDYIFNDRVKRRAEKKAPEREKNGTVAVHRAEASGNEHFGRYKPNSSAEMPPLARSKSATSISSQATGASRSILSNHAQGADAMGNADKFTMVPIRDAAEMRRRANANKTFIRVIFGATSFVLSYKVGLAFGVGKAELMVIE
jgi:hypothetical protein